MRIVFLIQTLPYPVDMRNSDKPEYIRLVHNESWMMVTQDSERA